LTTCTAPRWTRPDPVESTRDCSLNPSCSRAEDPREDTPRSHPGFRLCHPQIGPSPLPLCPPVNLDRGRLRIPPADGRRGRETPPYIPAKAPLKRTFVAPFRAVNAPAKIPNLDTVIAPWRHPVAHLHGDDVDTSRSPRRHPAMAPNFDDVDTSEGPFEGTRGCTLNPSCSRAEAPRETPRDHTRGFACATHKPILLRALCALL
jgi:hypothetical protein